MFEYMNTPHERVVIVNDLVQDYAALPQTGVPIHR